MSSSHSPTATGTAATASRAPASRPASRQAAAMTTLSATAGFVVPGKASHKARP